jgi:hypothetical protein
MFSSKRSIATLLSVHVAAFSRDLMVNGSTPAAATLVA